MEISIAVVAGTLWLALIVQRAHIRSYTIVRGARLAHRGNGWKRPRPRARFGMRQPYSHFPAPAIRPGVVGDGGHADIFLRDRPLRVSKAQRHSLCLHHHDTVEQVRTELGL